MDRLVEDSAFRDPLTLHEIIQDSVRQAHGQVSEVKDDKVGAVEDRYMCPICHSLLFRPVTGGCGHHFCSHCLTAWIEAAKRQEEVDRFSQDPWDVEQQLDRCPMCRAMIDMREFSKIDREFERNILEQHGQKTYNARHREAVADKVERLVAKQREQCSQELDMQVARASSVELDTGTPIYAFLGTAIAGPVGTVLGLGIGLTAPLVDRSYTTIRTEEMNRFGILEDEGAEEVPTGGVLLFNMTLTRVEARVFDVYGPNPGQPVEAMVMDPSSCLTFRVDEGALESTFHLEIVRKIALMDKVLAQKTVCRGRTYLLCCIDKSVQHDVSAECPSNAVHANNIGEEPVRLAFYNVDDGVCLFSSANVTVPAGEDALIEPDSEAESFKVVIWAQRDSCEVELASLQLRRGGSYKIDSRDKQHQPESISRRLETWISGNERNPAEDPQEDSTTPPPLQLSAPASHNALLYDTYADVMRNT